MAEDAFYLVGDRPVCFVALPDGGLDVQAFDWATGDFVREMGYLTRCLLGDPEVDELDAVTFAAHVARHRAALLGSPDRPGATNRADPDSSGRSP